MPRSVHDSKAEGRAAPVSNGEGLSKILMLRSGSIEEWNRRGVDTDKGGQNECRNAVVRAVEREGQATCRITTS
jgi:hypothetical protein